MISGRVPEVIENIYSKAKSCFNVGNIGVRESENLSPLLFCLYLADPYKFIPFSQ